MACHLHLFILQVNKRKPYHSVNFVIAHDGFTLHDLVSYNFKVPYYLVLILFFNFSLSIKNLVFLDSWFFSTMKPMGKEAMTDAMIILVGTVVLKVLS